MPFFFALFLSLPILAAAVQSTNNNASLCDSDSFVCHDGNCIPSDWVGDGERDCEDGTDEAQQQRTPKGGSSAQQEDPFQMRSSQLLLPSTSPRPAEQQNCSEQCVRPLGEWVARLESVLGQLDGNNTDSLFANTQSVRLLSSGCSLLSDCSPCASSPSLSSGLSPWLRLQLFLCELLGPSLNDHSACLGSPAGQQCPVPNLDPNPPSSFGSPCILLRYSLANIRCVQQQDPPPTGCTESALEMLAPLQSETEHWTDELGCAQMMAPTTVGPTTTTATMEESTTDELPPQWDALSTFVQAEQICSGAKSEMDAPVWARVCDRVDVLRANRDCLMELARREGTSCVQKPSSANSTCALVESFARSIDCAVRTLNEVCPPEAQEAVVGIQEQLNDEAIARQCFIGKGEGQEDEKIEGDSEFPLRPLNPKCSGEQVRDILPVAFVRPQEEASLVCLVELAELNGRLQRLPSLQLLVADNSSLGPVCELFARYEGCLQQRVFSRSAQKRCAFNSPLNALARIGLSPLCSPRSRQLLSLSSAQHCLSALSLANPLFAQCQAPMEAVGRAVGAMLQGVHGQAHLCKAFYSLRAAFGCGQRAMGERCEKGAAEELTAQLAEMLQKLETLALEEGCPRNEPPQLDSLLARPGPPQPRPPATSSRVPLARPLPLAVPAPLSQCDEEQHRRFTECVQPLTAFQPHPLAVIKQPKQIDQACEAFRNFSVCREQLIQCYPLWARGMSAMFGFACGQGNPLYLRVRQCIRRNIALESIKQCVVAFSRGAPQDACPSSKRLLECAEPTIGERCGGEAITFVRDYVSEFAKAVDPNCTMKASEESGRKGPVSALNCSLEQSRLVQQCAAPLNALQTQLGTIFQGGLHKLLKNLNGLAPLFAQGMLCVRCVQQQISGCQLSSQFRQCVAPVLASAPPQQCVVSSCLVASGVGICDQPDANQAIDTNLGCVFRQISDPDFGKCVRSTLVPLQQFTLSSLHSVLPQFVDCVQSVVLRACGPVPLNVLRVLASKDNICPIETEQTSSTGTPAPVGCTQDLRQARQSCEDSLLLSKHTFLPVVLLQPNNRSSLDRLCDQDLVQLAQCIRETQLCDAEEPYGKARALRALGTAICSSRTEFVRQMTCLGAVVATEEGQKCMDRFKALDEKRPKEEICGAVNASTQCLAPRVFADCGAEVLDFVFSATNEYLAQIVPASACQLEAPGLAIQQTTGCVESELIAYLECESHLDQFHPRPLALIANQTQWDQFCTVARSQFRPCVEALNCRPEPATKASLVLHETVCEREIARRDQRRFGDCILRVAERDSSRRCLDQFRTVDFLARDAGPVVCAAANELLQCTANEVNKECGEEALLHLYDVHNSWTDAYHAGCSLSPPNIIAGSAPIGQKVPPPVEFSEDQAPLMNKSSSGNAAEGQVEWPESEISNTTEPSTTTVPTTTTKTTTTKQAVSDTSMREMETTTATSNGNVPKITTTATRVKVAAGTDVSAGSSSGRELWALSLLAALVISLTATLA